MKKNKKYWKKQAKQWKKIAGIESESANEWSYKAFVQDETIGQLEQDVYTVYMDLQIESMLLKEAKEDYEDLDKQYIEALEKCDNYKKELDLLRQYNIGKKNTTGTSTKDYATWAIKQYNIPVGMDDKAKKLIEQYNTPVEENILRWWKRKN